MNPFIWKTYSLLFSRAAELHGFASTVLYQTESGPLVVWERQSAGARIYLSAGIHGDEIAGPLALLKLMDDGFFSTDINWAICPGINPTGLEACTRMSACGKDLNRDYLRRSSQEIATHSAWLASRNVPDLFLSLHEDCDVENFYFYEINTGQDRPLIAESILNAVRPWFAPEPGPIIDNHIPREPGWIFHTPEPDEIDGWPEAIFLAKQGCQLSFTFETPLRAVVSARVHAHCAAVRAACAEILR